MARSLGQLTVDLALKTGSFETDAGRAAKIAEKRAKEIDAAHPVSVRHKGGSDHWRFLSIDFRPVKGAAIPRDRRPFPSLNPLVQPVVLLPRTVIARLPLCPMARSSAS